MIRKRGFRDPIRTFQRCKPHRLILRLFEAPPCSCSPHHYDSRTQNLHTSPVASRRNPSNPGCNLRPESEILPIWHPRRGLGRIERGPLHRQCNTRTPSMTPLTCCRVFSKALRVQNDLQGQNYFVHTYSYRLDRDLVGTSPLV